MKKIIIALILFAPLFIYSQTKSLDKIVTSKLDTIECTIGLINDENIFYKDLKGNGKFISVSEVLNYQKEGSWQTIELSKKKEEPIIDINSVVVLNEKKTKTAGLLISEAGLNFGISSGVAIVGSITAISLAKSDPDASFVIAIGSSIISSIFFLKGSFKLMEGGKNLSLNLSNNGVELAFRF